MATLARPTSFHRTIIAPRSRDERPPKHKNEQRTEIWSNLLRQTREAQARSRTQAVQHRELIVCGGSPEDQQAFIRSLARPPPPAPPSRHRDQRGANAGARRLKGEVRLSNRYAYGYGHVTLYSPPQQSAGVGVLLGGEAEEVARLEVHTLPEPEVEYERTLRRLLEVKEKKEGDGEDVDDGFAGGTEKTEEGRRPAVCLLLSWKEPWRFLSLLRRWLQLLAQSLPPPGARAEDPLEVLKEHRLALTVVVQHVEAQEGLERENYREETFDYISQCIRTCVLPLSAALVYTSSSSPPQQPGAALSETQKVVYSSVGLGLSPLSPAPPKGSTPARREDLAPKHNVVDSMAIVVPSGWDSAGKIRLLSETFTPESVLEAWITDLKVPLHIAQTRTQDDDAIKVDPKTEPHANGGAEQEVYATSDAGEEDPDLSARSLTPSKPPISAIATYEQAILDPNAHKASKPPQIEVTTKPDQQFLAEMRAHLLHLEAEDVKHAKQNPDRDQRVSNTAAGRAGATGLPSGEQTGALGELGDVSFNVGGVSYNTVSAEAAIERLRRPLQPEEPPRAVSNPSLASSSPRTTTPRPPRREDKEVSAGTPTAAPASSARSSGGAKGDDLPIDKLEEYFHSLMKRGGGGGGGSGASTPSRGPQR
ncbi:hypothetical protein B0A55_08411 [Friedmanniomyces simplex]|uniref:Dynein light intermediate chain n=1 Tax=Friedmanniomyces simplex TaxID=329884 RepID=A0A4U0WVX3_9PEZI|nr:hypothetical protein B0A55_08411 [Friedmanniomyces simplex]